MRSSARTTVYLSGSLIRKFFRKKEYLLDSGDGWEALRALKATVPGWAEEIARLGRLGMRFAVFRNRKNVGAKNHQLMDLAGTTDIRIVPIVQGAKRAGILQTVIGVALIVASFFVAPGAQAGVLAAGIGASAGGVLQLLSPQVGGLKQSASPENLPSYAFGSAKNTVASGNPVPICVGNRRWGGAIISASIVAEDKA
ncbi:tail assembly protein [Pseudomonas sp. GD03842]|uniref:tail assembly protein n=1 Tax=Pseudomonas sp. GD03842 TaxID=2975385 RepID=UPI002447BC25|nr:tail assembly protein [Pseudomonas sp. GD03842]MDH0745301.1 tail assembly protein [Pseudomonas sp. GD03842]